MYVTRPLSFYKKAPESLSAPPPEGPNSGYLVIHDDESAMPSCFGRSRGLEVSDLPLPSNLIINFNFTDDGNEILTVPAINQPVSSNRYYFIKAHRKHKGEAYACANEEDKGISCGRSYIRDVKPRTLDPEDIYQQFEIFTKTASKGLFTVKSVAPDGHVPRFLRKKSAMQIQRSTTTSKDFIQESANGIDSSLRKQLPDFDYFNLSRNASEPVCVGRWYCPFMFVQDGKLNEQMNNSVYYVMTLEQRWERIFTTDRRYNQLGNRVMMDVVVPIQDVAIGGKEAVKDEGCLEDKVVWFRTIGSSTEQQSVGLSKLIVERMMWEEQRVGWVDGKERQVRLVREEEYGGIGWWAKFGCYVLVERFVLKRLDGSLVLTYDFRHIHQMKTKWE